MVNITNAEYADIHFTYGLVNGNAYEARRLFQDNFYFKKSFKKSHSVKTGRFEKPCRNGQKELQ